VKEPARTPRHTLPRECRLRSGAGFRCAYAEGTRARGELLVVVAVPNGLEHARLGLSVGKRVSKSAVRRNRVRRRLREAFRLRRGELGTGLDYVVIPTGAWAREPAAKELEAELVHLARRAADKARAKKPAARSRAAEEDGAPAP